MNYIKPKYELFGKIIQYVKNKKILDIGCVSHNLEKSNETLWVHGFLLKNSKAVIGIDILKDEIKELQKKGYNVKHGNAENFKLDKKFDIVFAGELIEHLSNPGLFLKQCRKHLKKKGLLIITTPNTFNLYENFINVLLLRTNPPVNSEHTFYYSPTTIKELLQRDGFNIQKIDYFDFYGTFIGKMRFNFFNLFGKKFKRRMVIFAN